MNQSNAPKKFSLNRQTIKQLQDETLDEVVGGNATQARPKSVIQFAVPGTAGRYSCYYTCATE